MAQAGLPLIPGPKMVAPGVKWRWVEEDICGKRWWVAVEVVYSKNSWCIMSSDLPRRWPLFNRRLDVFF